MSGIVGMSGTPVISKSSKEIARSESRGIACVKVSMPPDDTSAILLNPSSGLAANENASLSAPLAPPKAPSRKPESAQVRQQKCTVFKKMYNEGVS